MLVTITLAIWRRGGFDLTHELYGCDLVIVFVVITVASVVVVVVVIVVVIVVVEKLLFCFSLVLLYITVIFCQISLYWRFSSAIEGAVVMVCRLLFGVIWYHGFVLLSCLTSHIWFVFVPPFESIWCILLAHAFTGHDSRLLEWW